MLLKLIGSGIGGHRRASDTSIDAAKSVVSSKTAGQEVDPRQQMYERIARGNAMNEVEENSQRMWRGD